MIVIEKQGSLLSMRDLSLDVLQPSKPTKRGKVTDFSNASRRRLLELTARLNVDDVRCVFLTLTFSGFPHPDLAKSAFRRFLKRVHRKFPQCSGLWRVEMQQRGSPHFHLILFDFPFWNQADIQTAWTACTKEEKSFVWVTLMKNKRHVMTYVSKYVAKKPSLDKASYLTATDTQGIDHVEKWLGRHWGVFNAELLPFAKREIAVIRDPEIMAYFRWTSQAMAHSKKVGLSPVKVTLFTTQADDMFKHAVSLSNLALLDKSTEPDNRYMRNRNTRKRIQLAFRIRAMNDRKGFAERQNDKVLSSFWRLPLPSERA